MIVSWEVNSQSPSSPPWNIHSDFLLDKMWNSLQRTPRILRKTWTMEIRETDRTYVCCMSLTDQSPPWCSVKVLTDFDETLSHYMKTTSSPMPCMATSWKNTPKENVDAYPKCNNHGIKELRTSSAPPHPLLSSKHDNSHNNRICNKATSHNVMCKALSWPLVSETSIMVFSWCSPRWSPRQYPLKTMAPNNICVQPRIGYDFPNIPWATTKYGRIVFSWMCSFR